MSDIAQFAYEKQTELKERVKTLEIQANEIDNLNKDLVGRQVKLCQEVADIKARAKAKITEMKAEVKQEIKAVEQILKAIKDGRSSHWQKRENIRLVLEILATIPTFDRGDFFNYEDDF